MGLSETLSQFNDREVYVNQSSNNNLAAGCYEKAQITVSQREAASCPKHCERDCGRYCKCVSKCLWLG